MKDIIEWHPIESAPLDGTRVRLKNASTGLEDVGQWDDYSSRGVSVSGIIGEWNQDLGNGDMTHWAHLQE